MTLKDSDLVFRARNLNSFEKSLVFGGLCLGVVIGFLFGLVF